MKTKISILSAITILALVFSFCVKNKEYVTYTIHRPVYAIKQEVKDNARLQEPTVLKNLGNFVLYGNAMYVVERNKGIHVIDYSNPSSPVNKGFVPVPGNTGVSIKNDVLYADCYTDLFVFQLNNGGSLELKNNISNAFVSRGSEGTAANVIALTWIDKDTTVATSAVKADETTSNQSSGQNGRQSSNNTGGGNTSVGSSMAVFTIIKNHLYAVDNMSLRAFSIENAVNPFLQTTTQVGGNIETIFPLGDRLFIGSNSGMFIYDVTAPSVPTFVSQLNHVRSCDPVIADEKFAYVTLRSGTSCGGFTNQMDVINIEDIVNPVLLRSYPFSNPHGLDKDGNVMFVCDGNSGLKVVDASDVNNIITRKTLSVGNVLDVVALNRLAFVMLDNSIQIYSYDAAFNVQQLGSLSKN